MMKKSVHDIIPLFRRPRFSYHAHLDGRLWNRAGQLDMLVSNALQMVAWNYIVFLQRQGFPLTDANIVDIFIHGSSTNYYYDKSSDIDICIVADMTAIHAALSGVQYKPLIKGFLHQWHGLHRVSICGRGVDIELVDAATPTYGPGMYKVGGAYSLTQDKWMRYPKKLSKVDCAAVRRRATQIFKTWRAEYRLLLRGAPDLVLVDRFLDRLNQVRVDCFVANPLSCVTAETMAFRMFRRAGMLHRLRVLAKQLRSACQSDCK